MERKINYRLPLPGRPRLLMITDYSGTHGRLEIGGTTFLESADPVALSAGIAAYLPDSSHRILMRRKPTGDLEVLFDDRTVPEESELVARTSRSAWLHAWIALTGSLFGFIASYLYLRRSTLLADPWALKMAIHMAGWHLLLTLTLFPASAWGQRPGIRCVQAASAVFALIHAGIALSNGMTDVSDALGFWIALFNAASGVAFCAAVVYGQVAYRDMDPLADIDPARDERERAPWPDPSVMGRKPSRTW